MAHVLLSIPAVGAKGASNSGMTMNETGGGRRMLNITMIERWQKFLLGQRRKLPPLRSAPEAMPATAPAFAAPRRCNRGGDPGIRGLTNRAFGD
jgi:hypothetical protein